MPTRRSTITEISFFTIILNAILFSLAMTFILTGGPISWKMLSEFKLTTFGVTLLILQIAYASVSIKSVRMDELAVLLRFGAYVTDVTPGLVFVPFGISVLVKSTTGILAKDLPIGPEKIWHGDPTSEGSDGKVPEGYLPAIRITFAPNPEDVVKITTPTGVERIIPEDDPFLQRNTAEVEGSYGWQINDLRQLIAKFGMHNTLAKAQSQMDDICIATLNNELPQMTPAEAMTKMSETGDKVKAALTLQSTDWGITVAFFRLKPFGFSHKLNQAVREAAESLPKKVAAIRASEALQQSLTNEGKGRASAEYDLLSARAKGNAELAKVAETSAGKFAMGVQAVQSGIAGAKTAIFTPDSFFGSIAGVTEMIRQSAGETREDTTQTASLADTNKQEPRQTQPRRKGGNKK